MFRKTQIVKEWNELRRIYGSHEINIIFSDVDAYQKIRSYTTYKEVKESINLIIKE